MIETKFIEYIYNSKMGWKNPIYKTVMRLYLLILSFKNQISSSATAMKLWTIWSTSHYHHKLEQ
jgi:hypothetical protein